MKIDSLFYNSHINKKIDSELIFFTFYPYLVSRKRIATNDNR